MKCVILATGVVRIDDKTAEILVRAGQARYTSKEHWKSTGRRYLSNDDKPVKHMEA